MGTKPGKHARDPSSEEGEGSDGAPQPKKSPKILPGKKKKSSRPSSPDVDTSPSKRVGTQTVSSSVTGGTEETTITAIPPSLSETEKENIDNGTAEEGEDHTDRKSDKSSTTGIEQVIVSSHLSPVRMEPREMEPLTPLVINDNRHHPRATSTPAANGDLVNNPFSPDSVTDGSDDEAFSPSSDQQPPSPSVSFNSTSTSSVFNKRSHSDSVDTRRPEMNFGRFYNTSYLGLNSGKAGYSSRGSLNQHDKKDVNGGGSHFHRPPNFTYAKEPPTFLKKKGTGMSALTSVTRVVKVRRSSSPADIRNLEAVRMSVFPSAKPKLPDEPDKIERDDWPGPACPAAILPEILRQRRRSRGEKDDDDDEDEVKEDPRIQRELKEISKIKDESGIGKVIYRELETLKAKPHQPLDPWKASRAPSAKFEPRYSTRFQSPMFASPSRFLDRPRYAWDDNDIRAYRSASTLANLPTPKPGYGPSYMTPRAATLPLSGAYGARDDWRFFEFDETDDRPNTNLSSSTLTGHSNSTRHDSSYSGYEGPNISLLKLQKSTWHSDIEPPIYDYERLKITNFDLPKDVDINHLEIHLTNEDFDELFKIPRDRFYRMAEWKRNDVKRKLNLY